MKPLTFQMIALLTGFIAISAFGQNNNKKGYVVENNGDTLRGWINYKNWRKNPQQILFKKDSLTDNVAKFGPDDIICFEITGFDKYIKAIVEKDIRPVDQNQLVEGTENMTITDTVFLRQIVSGSTIDLYELIDTKPHYFIKEAAGPFKELSYKVFINERSNIANQKNYINQLRAVAGNKEMPSSLETKINTAGYKEQDLKEVVAAINKLNGSVYYSTGSTSGSRIKAALFAGIGGGYSSLRFKGEQFYMEKMSYSGGFSPYFSVGMDLVEQRNLQALFIRIELSYYSTSYTGEGATASNLTDTSNVILKYQLKQQNISPSLSVLYSFINKESYKIYAGAGVAYNFSSYSENKFTTIKPGNKSKELENYIVPSKHWVSMNATLGMRITKHWDAAVKADLYGSFTNYPTFSLNPNTYTAQLRWFFL
ncbi:hypothetical protein [Agriterribacter sp.]|uniref:hypothetical protein n=1 Tax=Agriterribacter sp. TaxID=2821509 RepID=UPI002C244E00|nr:hypothetical protein [Agriterribacter sp.]HRO45398.1 hypothetical protein [Agriterribacter sp.]HRQ16910.1 hypothetical protein [Agriterribacter sp.]